jgi:hypothetical protein
VALFLIILVADLVQYWTHRAYHEVPLLWRLHAVHHSVKSMDWMAGSRQHILELIITRSMVLAPIYVLGFSKEVIDAYIVIVGFQAVFNHANVSVRLGPLRYVLVTPNFHHWHHSQDQEALDKNYAAHFAFLDYLFGTAVKSTKLWPEHYGVLGDYVPNGFIKQLKFPFTWKGWRRRRRPVLRRRRPGSAALARAADRPRDKVAEKIRISGGGRANFTNRDLDPAAPQRHFLSDNPQLLPLGAGALHAARLHRAAAAPRHRLS